MESDRLGSSLADRVVADSEIQTLPEQELRALDTEYGPSLELMMEEVPQSQTTNHAAEQQSISTAAENLQFALRTTPERDPRRYHPYVNRRRILPSLPNINHQLPPRELQYLQEAQDHRTTSALVESNENHPSLNTYSASSSISDTDISDASATRELNAPFPPAATTTRELNAPFPPAVTATRELNAPFPPSKPVDTASSGTITAPTAAAAPPPFEHRLSTYVSVVGNYSSIHQVYFLALRFIKPVIYFKFFTHQYNRNRIPTPEGHIVLVNEVDLVRLESINRSLVFTESNNDAALQRGSHPDNVNRGMLLRLLENNNSDPRERGKDILHWAYGHETLFAVVTHNPFKPPEYVKSRRDDSFRALESLYGNILRMSANYRPPLEEFCNLRFFHRNLNSPKSFKSWFHLANYFGNLMYINRYTVSRVQVVTSDFGARLHRIFNRLRAREKFEMSVAGEEAATTTSEDCNSMVVEQQTISVPGDFYTCEVTLETDVPVGIVFNQTNGVVNYVSPMVVSKLNRRFHDVNLVECYNWFPLFKDVKTFMKKGLDAFVGDFNMNRRLLESIMAYLSVQVGEKFAFMHADLKIACKVLVD